MFDVIRIQNVDLLMNFFYCDMLHVLPKVV